MSKPQDVDGVIIRWGHRAERQVQPTKGRASKQKPPRSKIPKPSLASVKRNIAALAKGKPQVMVKVTGGGRSVSTIRAHMTYLTKHGEIQLENEKGEVLAEKDAIEAELDTWCQTSPSIKPMEKLKEDLEPGEKLQRREAVNIVFSMPKGTDPQGVRAAVKALASEHFGERHRYVMALHIDREHPHVHLCIMNRSFVDKQPLDTRKPVLQALRQSFAEQLYHQGIAATATTRATRNAKSYQRTFSEHTGEKDRVIRREHGERQSTPAMNKVAQAERIRFSNAVDALARSADPADRALAEVFVNGPSRPYFNPKEHSAVQRNRRLSAAYLYQSAIGHPDRQRAPQTLARMGDVPSVNVVPPRERD
jgi:hypothetical protein